MSCFISVLTNPTSPRCNADSFLKKDLIDIFKNWFNPGFLKLRKITWDTKANILEKLLSNIHLH